MPDRMPKISFGSPILEAGQVVIAGMRVTTGWGQPEHGEMFDKAAARFDSAGRTLATAHPQADWEGVAAQAYATANHQQIGRADAIAVLDRAVHQVVDRQARQVAARRNNLDEQSDFLADLSYTTWALALIPGVGKAAKTGVELAAVATAVSHSGQELFRLSNEVADNTTELLQLASRYTMLTVPESPPALDVDPLPRGEPADEVLEDEDARSPQVPGEDTQSDVAPSDVAPPPVPGGTSRDNGNGAALDAAIPPVPAAATGGPPAPTVRGGAAPATPADPMSGLTSAFGTVGGLIGAIVAPLTATVAGAVGAAGQSLQALMADGPESLAAEKSNADDGPGIERAAISDGTPDGDDDPAAEPPGVSASAQGLSPSSAETTVGSPPASPLDTVDRSAPTAPPAATRPPQ